MTTNWKLPLQKAVATFVFASTGILLGGTLSDLDVWETAMWVGVGSLVNFAYRWAEATLRHTDA